MKNIISDHTCSVAAKSRMFSCFLLFLLAQQGWSKVPWILSKGAQRRSGQPTPAARLRPVHASLSSVHNVVSLRSGAKDEASDGFSLNWSWTQQDCMSHELIGQLVLASDVMCLIKGSSQSFAGFTCLDKKNICPRPYSEQAGVCFITVVCSLSTPTLTSV